MKATDARLDRACLYGIVDLGYVSADAAMAKTEAMLRRGVDVIQLRAKNVDEAEIVALGSRLAPACRSAGVPFILNDHPGLVKAVGADGVHVGQDDVSVAAARAEAGAGALVGKSTHSVAQAEAACHEGADYIGFGPLFATPTKPDYVPIGLEEIRVVHGRVTVPIFCIGGIKRENLPTILAAGARRVVIVSGLLQAADTEQYARDCRAVLAPPQP